jgi:hypothetical protein
MVYLGHDVLEITRYEKQEIHVTAPHRLAAVLDGTRKCLERRFGLCAAAAATAIAAAAAAITTTEHFAVNKLGNVGDEILVVARSKSEQEKALDVDRFHHQLYKTHQVVSM